MARAPVISLILSCYNQQPWLGLVLASVASQRIDVPFELLICDDGSSDATLETIRGWAATTAVDVRYVWQPDRRFRLSRSRNNAIRCAQGDIVVFVDGDTWLAPTFLDDHRRAHDGGESLVCGRRTTIVMAEADLRALDAHAVSRLPLARQAEQIEQEQWMSSGAPWMACLGGNFSAKRSAGLCFDEDFESWGSEDRELAFRLFRAGATPRLLERSNAVQLRLAGSRFTEMNHDRVVELIRNKRLLQSKYPGGELALSVALARYCHFDRATESWRIGAYRTDVSAEDVFREFEQWSDRRAQPSERGTCQV